MTGKRLRLVDGAVGVAAIAAVVSWFVVLLAQKVPLDYLGDEAARILFSYEVSSPASLVSWLFTSEAWVDVHPAGDGAFKGALNWVADPVLDSSTAFVTLHQIAAWVCVVAGLVFVVVGVARRFGVRPAIYLGALAVSATPVVYVAHHAVGESVALLLVGAGVYLSLARPMVTTRRAVVAAIPIAAAAVVRPEAGVVMAGLAIVPLWERKWLPAIVYASVSVAPVVVTTVLIELTSDAESYASIRRFARIAFFDVVTDERMREVIWGFGVFPYLGVAVVAVAVFRLGRRRFEVGSALVVGWLFIALLFTSQIALGAIHQQDRAYVFPAVLGLIATAALLSRLLNRLDFAGSVVAGVVVLAVLVFSTVDLWANTYPGWQNRVSDESRAVSSILEEHSGPDDAILLDWMWWQEWRAAVYASQPGLDGPYCVYFRCLVEPDPELVAGLPTPETEKAMERLVNAASFIEAERPLHIVMFTDERYEEWLVWRRNQEPFPSFVRPLLEREADCYRTLSDLGGDRYCPILENDHYVVLERS